MIRYGRMILCEMRLRPLNGLLLVLVVAATSGLIVFFYTASSAMGNETRIIQKQIGSNLTLIPADADRSAYQMTGVVDATMSEGVIDQLLEQDAVSMNHLIAVLDRPVEIAGVPALLTGIAKSKATPGRPKSPMNDGVPEGSVELGYAIAKELEAEVGEQVVLYERPFTVAQVYLEKGTDEDYRVFADLADAQRMLGLDGRINKIMAIDCVSCQDPSAEALPILRAELLAAAPEVQVLRAAHLADARARQRTAIEQYHGVLIPAILIAAMAAVSGIMMMNLRDRAGEIGLLRALGKGGHHIAFLFLGKAALLTAVGTLIGVALGSLLAVELGRDIFALSATKIRLDWTLIVSTLAAAPLFACLATALPALAAVLKDPAQTLQDR